MVVVIISSSSSSEKNTVKQLQSSLPGPRVPRFIRRGEGKKLEHKGDFKRDLWSLVRKLSILSLTARVLEQ